MRSLTKTLLVGISCSNWLKTCPNKLGQFNLKQQRKSTSTRRKSILVQAVAVPVAPPPSMSSPMDDTQNLKQLAENYGFKEIGEPLPDDVTLRDIIASLPKKVFEINEMKAWGSVLISVTSYALGIFMIAKAPWYLLPLAWAWTGTAVTGVSFIYSTLFQFQYLCASRDFTCSLCHLL